MLHHVHKGSDHTASPLEDTEKTTVYELLVCVMGNDLCVCLCMCKYITVCVMPQRKSSVFSFSAAPVSVQTLIKCNHLLCGGHFKSLPDKR